jgi:membrane associated rhomboid family serine protease
MYQRPPSFYFPPLRDTPAVAGLLLLCVAVFLFEFFAAAGNMGISLVDAYAWPLSTHWFATLRLWQPFTYPFVHTDFLSLLFDGLGLYFFAGSLERAWGTTRFLVFFFMSSVIVGLILLGLWARSDHGPTLLGLGPGIWLAMIVAFATLNPFATILLMFIIPLQARWLAWITIAIEIFAFFSYYGGPIQAVLGVGAISALAFAFTSRDFRGAIGRVNRGPKGPSIKERFERWQQRRRMRQWQKRVSRIDKPEDLFKDK